ncbi:MAG: nucleoside deaminase [Ginsengibacter sp.]
MNEEYKFMSRCLQLAEQALESGNPLVGSVLVVDGNIIGEGIESGKSSGDVTDHAEIIAIRNAIENGFVKDLPKAKLYSTHEPCIMCSYVIRHHHIPNILFGIPVEFVGGYTSVFKVLTSEQVPKWGKSPEISVGICKEACEMLNKKFELKKSILNS